MRLTAGFVAGDDEEDDHAVQLVLREMVAFVLSSHESAHQVVRRCGASAREERVEIGDELVGVSRELLDELRRHRRKHERVRPFPEPRLVLDGDA